MTETILRLKDVTKRTGLSRSSIYEKIRNKEFPKQISLGRRASGWVESQVDTWIYDRINASCNEVA